MDLLYWLLFLAGFPIGLIIAFVYMKDKNREPTKLLISLFLLGIASCFLVLLISDALGAVIPLMRGDYKKMSPVEILLYAFFGVALIEEVCKWIMVYFKGYNNKEFDEVYDIIVYAVCVSLGFAFFENIIYIISAESAIETAILRGLSAVPGHACDAIFMGYYLSLAKQYQYKKDYDNEKKYIALSIIIPTILHGIYDYCLMSGLLVLVFVFLVFIVYLYTISIRKLKIMSQNNKQFEEEIVVEEKIIENNSNEVVEELSVEEKITPAISTSNQLPNYCSKCGHKLTGPYCGNCGARQA